ncbi:hypothetical protein DFJ77DRAFT_460696 [Powellomyces hirtus]|nr:hypothetical protein DFJ77DRAFT_460696 [Powellomyces hirtus]
MFTKSILYCSAAALLAASAVSAQCVEEKPKGDAAFVVSGWENLVSTPTGADQWDITPSAEGYVAIHFNEIKCMDLSRWQGVSFDLTVPPSGAFQVSWAVRSADCQTKSTVQQDFVDGAKYVKDGKFFVPFADFVPKLDLKAVEDLTLIKLTPAAPGWKIANVRLSCGATGGNSTVPSATKGTASATATNGAQATAASTGDAPNAAVSASAVSLGSLAAVAAVAGSVILL